MSLLYPPFKLSKAEGDSGQLPCSLAVLSTLILSSLCFRSVSVFSSELIDALVATVGVDRAMMGSDDSFEISDPDPSASQRHETVRNRPRRKPLFRNVSRLFDITE